LKQGLLFGHQYHLSEIDRHEMLRSNSVVHLMAVGPDTILESDPDRRQSTVSAAHIEYGTATESKESRLDTPA
jgi:hypothetical protein